MSEHAYELRVARDVAKEIKKAPPGDRKALLKAMKALELNPRPPGHAKLKVRDLGEYRVRVRSYRIRYDVDDDAKVIFIQAVKHRGEAYRT